MPSYHFSKPIVDRSKPKVYPRHNICQHCKCKIKRGKYCSSCKWSKRAWLVPFIVVAIALIMGEIT